MDNLSAGTASSLSLEKRENVPADCPASLSTRRQNDSTKPATDSNTAGKLDAFPLESLDAFDWNHWMTSIGISGCFRLESVDALPRNTHLMNTPRTTSLVGGLSLR